MLANSDVVHVDELEPTEHWRALERDARAKRPRAAMFASFI